MPETMTADELASLRTAVLQHLRAGRREIAEGVDEQQEVVEAPFDETTSIDDQWQAEVAADLQTLLEDDEAKQAADVAAARNLDFSPTQRVRPGAVIGMDGERFVVGLVLDEFRHAGHTYSGISTDSPLYEAINGMQAGDEFALNGQHHRIEFVA